MAVELGYITDALLCKYYHITLADVEAMHPDQHAVLVRFMEMRQRIEQKAIKRARASYG